MLDYVCQRENQDISLLENLNLEGLEISEEEIFEEEIFEEEKLDYRDFLPVEFFIQFQIRESDKKLSQEDLVKRLQEIEGIIEKDLGKIQVVEDQYLKIGKICGVKDEISEFISAIETLDNELFVDYKLSLCEREVTEGINVEDDKELNIIIARDYRKLSNVWKQDEVDIVWARGLNPKTNTHHCYMCNKLLDKNSRHCKSPCKGPKDGCTCRAWQMEHVLAKSFSGNKTLQQCITNKGMTVAAWALQVLDLANETKEHLQEAFNIQNFPFRE